MRSRGVSARLRARIAARFDLEDAAQSIVACTDGPQILEPRWASSLTGTCSWRALCAASATVRVAGIRDDTQVSVYDVFERLTAQLPGCPTIGRPHYDDDHHRAGNAGWWHAIGASAASRLSTRVGWSVWACEGADRFHGVSEGRVVLIERVVVEFVPGHVVQDFPATREDFAFVESVTEQFG